MNMELYVFATLVLIALINCAATVGVVRDAALTSTQRVFQVALVWCLPVLGALVTYFFRRFTSTQQTHRNIFDSPSIGEASSFSLSEQQGHSGGGHHDQA
jgi:hypothetical protein